MEGFNKSLEEILNFADDLRLHEKEVEQKHTIELEKQKAEYDIQIQIEKRRVEQLQDINRTLTEQVERGTQKQTDLEQRYSVLLTKYNCCTEEIKRLKDLHNEKKLRIEELEKIARILTNGKLQLDDEVQQLKNEKQNLEKQLKEIQESQQKTPDAIPTATTHPEPDEVVELVEKAIAENSELKNLLMERDNEIRKLNDQLEINQSQDSQAVEQRLLQAVAKLKSDFKIMYENQSNFFLQNIDRLKQAQADNIASLYRY